MKHILMFIVAPVVGIFFCEDTRMAKPNHVKEMEILNRNFMDDVVSFNEKRKLILLHNDTPDEDKVKVANAALFVSLAVH